MSLFSFLKQTRPIVLSFHDDSLQALQFSRHDNGYDLVGYNEMALAKGIVTEGNIADMNTFQSAVAELFSQAQPESIHGKKLYVNIPPHLLYTFVGDFASNTKEDSLKESMMGIVRQHSPFPYEELTFDFASAKKGRKLSYAAYGNPTRWQKRFLKACQSADIASVEFIPEPLCYQALFAESLAENAALFSNDGTCVFLSVFRNGLIYDSFLVTKSDESGTIDCAECLSGFKKAQEDFASHFDNLLNTLFFAGFNKTSQKSIEEYFKSEKNPLIFFDPEKMANIGKLLPYEVGRSTLFGLLHFLVKGEKQEGAIVSEQKALKLRRRSF